jgi:hypothetical protein
VNRSPGNTVSLKLSGYYLPETGVRNSLLLKVQVVIGLMAPDEARSKGQ